MGNQRLSITPSGAVGDERISDSVHRTLCAYGLYGSRTGWCFPGLSTIAKIRGISKSTASRHLKVLKECGYVNVYARYDKHTRARRSNRVQIRFDYADDIEDDLVTGEELAELDREQEEKEQGEDPPRSTQDATGGSHPGRNTPLRTGRNVNVPNNAPSDDSSRAPAERKRDVGSVKDRFPHIEESKNQMSDPELVPEGMEFEDDRIIKNRPKYTLPDTSLSKRALLACGRGFFRKGEKHLWKKIEKGMMSLSSGLTGTYPTEWVMDRIRIAEEMNGTKGANKPSSTGVKMTFPNLLAAINNEAKRVDWVAKEEEKGIVITAKDDDDLGDVGRFGMLEDDPEDLEELSIMLE